MHPIPQDTKHRKRRKIVVLINKKKKKPLEIFGNYSVDSTAILLRLGLATLCHLFFALFNPRRVVDENLAWRSRMSLRTRTPALGRTGVRVCQRHRAITCSCQVKNPSKSARSPASREISMQSMNNLFSQNRIIGSKIL